MCVSCFILIARGGWVGVVLAGSILARVCVSLAFVGVCIFFTFISWYILVILGSHLVGSG